MQHPGITRRSFVAATAVAGLAAAAGADVLAGLSPQTALADEAEGEEHIVRTCCAGCVGRCGVLAHVKDGRVVKLEGDPEHVYSKGNMCAKGLSHIQMLYNPNRIKYPLRRVGERGENKWERVSWDEALADIARQLIESQEKYGAECTLVGHGGGGATYYADSAKRFCHIFGCQIFEPGGLQCLQPRQTVHRLMWGKNNNDFVSYCGLNLQLIQGDKTKCMVLWGSNPAQSNVGSAGRPTAEMRANGTKTIVVDPRFTPDASKADVWLPVRPGTDVALLMSWINYILQNKLYDEESLMRWTNLPYLVNMETKLTLRPEDLGIEGEEHTTRVVWDKNTGEAQLLHYPWDDALDPALEGGPYTVNGIECYPAYQLLAERVAEWTVERAAEVCWLEPEKIEEAIKIFVENQPGFISMGMCSDHSLHSTQAGIAQFILESIMGHFGKPGTMMQQFTNNPNPYWAEPGLLEHFMPEEQYIKRFGAVEFKASCNKEWAHNGMMLEAIMTGQPYKPRIVIERSTNKMINMPNAQRWAKAWESMDLIVHHVMYPTSFSMFADYLLPTTENLENHWVNAFENRVYVRQPCTHLWEGVEEPLFWSMLSKAMADAGHQRFIDSFDPEKTAVNDQTVPANFFAGASSSGDESRAISNHGQIPWWSSMEEMLTNVFASNSDYAEGTMTWEELAAHVQENGCYQITPDEDYTTFRKYEQLDADGKPLGFGTKSKKLECYSDGIVLLGRTGEPWAFYRLPPCEQDYDPLPYYHEMIESPLNPDFADYPLVMTGGHINMYTHATLRNVPWIRERFPVPDTLINPVDAAQYGIADGDWLWIESKRGRTQGHAKVTEMVGPGVVHMERFWFPETLDTPTHGYTEMNVNMLTDDQCQCNDIIGSSTYRGFQVRVEKADSAPAGIWTEPEQFAAWLPNYAEVEVTDQADMTKGVY